MRICHVEHSGFLAETRGATLLFDYWKGELPRIDPDLPLIVFASHAHRDHFSAEVFLRVASRKDAAFVLSDDIRRFRRAALLKKGALEPQLDRITWIRPHATASVGPATVETLASTDAGVAFIVTVGEETVYHAGDLNLWLWDDDTPEETRDMERRFTAELDRVRGRRFDAAFLPLDPRLGDAFCRGFDSFMRATDTRAAYPMHLWDDRTVVDRLLAHPCSLPYRDKIKRP